MIEMLISFALTASGFSIGTASFVVGLYIREFNEMAPKKKLMPFVYLIVSLIVLPIIVISISCMVIAFSCQPLWLKLNLALIILTPIAPAVAIIYILIRNSPTKRA